MIKQRGFTLIELLVVIAIAAAMTGIVVTSMSSWFAGVERRTAAAELQLAVQHAIKMAALKARPLEISTLTPTTPQIPPVIGVSNADEPALKLPVGWSVERGAKVVAKGGFCLGGSLGFKSSDSTATLLVERGTCEVRFEPQG